MNRNDAHIGMKVTYGRSRGEKTRGEIVKINHKTAKVRQLEARGTMKSHPVGTIWTVPFSLMAPADSPANPTPAPANVPRTFRKYDRVQFRPTRGKFAGRTIKGTVERVNRKPITVTPDEPEYPGQYWRVSPGLLSPVS